MGWLNHQPDPDFTTSKAGAAAERWSTLRLGGPNGGVFMWAMLLWNHWSLWGWLGGGMRYPISSDGAIKRLAIPDLGLPLDRNKRLGWEWIWNPRFGPGASDPNHHHQGKKSGQLFLHPGDLIKGFDGRNAAGRLLKPSRPWSPWQNLAKDSPSFAPFFWGDQTRQIFVFLGIFPNYIHCFLEKYNDPFVVSLMCFVCY